MEHPTTKDELNDAMMAGLPVEIGGREYWPSRKEADRHPAETPRGQVIRWYTPGKWNSFKEVRK